MDSPQVQVVILLDLAFVLGGLCVFLAGVALNRHGAYRAIRERALSFSDLYNSISEGVFRSTLDGHMISANPALVRLNGFTSEAEMLNEVTDIAGQWYVDPNRRGQNCARSESGRHCRWSGAENKARNIWPALPAACWRVRECRGGRDRRRARARRGRG